MKSSEGLLNTRIMISVSKMQFSAVLAEIFLTLLLALTVAFPFPNRLESHGLSTFCNGDILVLL